MATDWSDPTVISTIVVGIGTVAATVWAGWWTVTRDRRKKAAKGQVTVAVGIVQKGKK
jgi:hypothetical protein